ncbi:uncharacterized protein LOC116030943 isoform X4 [Ipomoea triloba]|uniref:uncharacterized protein LOC116030943 isoform X4 n=1 Tax=Ipomoea triloba TaxID=35885 RepID=UPI00125DC0C7|nr:uncharacterized protein LOC116030943 isoform X4 [Ipomoea triloba]
MAASRAEKQISPPRTPVLWILLHHSPKGAAASISHSTAPYRASRCSGTVKDSKVLMDQFHCVPTAFLELGALEQINFGNMEHRLCMKVMYTWPVLELLRGAIDDITMRGCTAASKLPETHANKCFIKEGC